MKTVNVTFEITNEELFNELVIDVNTSGLKSKGTDSRGNSLGFYGSLEIEKEDGNGWVTTTGEFGTNDYKEELGFVLIVE